MESIEIFLNVLNRWFPNHSDDFKALVAGKLDTELKESFELWRKEEIKEISSKDFSNLIDLARRVVIDGKDGTTD